jgi:7-cyano-7-deazaguanine synthase in queuosine biosynthesis
MDSYVMNYLIKPDVLLYVKVGSSYEIKELKKIYEFVKDKHIENKLIVSDLSFLNQFALSNAHVPLRNLYFIQQASLYGDEIYLGALKGEISKDKSAYFRKTTEELLSYCWNDTLMLDKQKTIKVIFPFAKLTKTQMLKQYIQKNGSIEDLVKYTISCYDEQEGFCGECMSCFRRYVAEVNNGLETRENYTNDPMSVPLSFVQNLSIKDKIKKVFSTDFLVNIPSNIDYLMAKRRLSKK